jgi:hypothetical protein
VLGLLLVAALLLTAYREEIGWNGGSSELIVGSGVPASETRDVEPFTAVDLTGASNLVVRVGDELSVVVHADDNIVPLVSTEVRDGALVVATDDGFTTVNEVRVDVTVPTLDGMRLTGSGVVAVEGIQGKELDVLLSGSGALSASGTVDVLTATVSGAGSARLADLRAGAVDALVSGTGLLEVYASDSLDAAVTGTGVILFGGHPASVERSVAGTGAIVER